MRGHSLLIPKTQCRAKDLLAAPGWGGPGSAMPLQAIAAELNSDESRAGNWSRVSKCMNVGLHWSCQGFHPENVCGTGSKLLFHNQRSQAKELRRFLGRRRTKAVENKTQATP